MRHASPPRWLEWILIRVLPLRDRETVSGDLFEEYCEDRVPRLGPVRANYWYLRQALSFAAVRILGGSAVKNALIVMSVFTIAAGSWLAVMENVLKHDGYAGRAAMDVLIAIQGLATLLLVLFRLGSVLRVVVMLGAAAILWVGASAVFHILRAPHFEGFVLVIGAGLIVEGALTLGTLMGARYLAG